MNGGPANCTGHIIFLHRNSRAGFCVFMSITSAKGHHVATSTFTQVPNPLPAAFLRGGTSKGIFINRKHLPPSRSDWSSIFLAIMGSPDPEHGRQLNGMGGGVSSLSKIMVVGPPMTHEAASGIDAEYTFAQVGIRDANIDFSGNCGNLSSMIGAFAVDEDICAPRMSHSASGSVGSLGTVRMWNTNTNKEVHTTFPVSPDSKPVLDLEQISIAGVPGKASQISLDFVDPGGAMTGRLLPTGKAVDHLTISHEGKTTQYVSSLVDATNPTVFIASEDLFSTLYLPSGDVYTKTLLDSIERIRKAGAEAMGLDPSAQAQPKVAILGFPSDSQDLSTLPDGHPVDICVQAISMGVPHRAVPITVGLCLGVAATIRGTVPHRIIEQVRTRGNHVVDSERSQQGLIRLQHPGGVIDVGAELDEKRNIRSAKVVRTGRRLMQGAVWW